MGCVFDALGIKPFKRLAASVAGFQVKDLEAMVSHLKSLGYEPSEIMYPFEGNDKLKICYFRGPNDEKLELVQADE